MLNTPMPYSNMSDGLFAEWCCVNRALHKVSEIVSKSHLINITSACFMGTNMSRDEQFNTVIHLFRNSTFTYTEEECHLPTKCAEGPTKTSLLYVAFWCFMLVLTVVSNSLVIIANQRIAYLKHNIANIFISSLAVSDLLVALFVIPLKISTAYHNVRFCHSDAICRFHVTTDNVFFSASITNLFVITIDRYLALNRPYSYPRLITKSRSRIMICLVWLYGCAWGSLSNLNWGDINKPSIYVRNYSCRSNNFIHACFTYSFVFYIPVFIMGVLYYRIFSIARHHAKNISETATHSPNTTIREVNNNNIETADEVQEAVIEEKKERADSLQQLNGSPSLNSISKYINRYNINKNVTLADIRVTSRTLQNIQYRKMMLRAVKTIATVYGTFILCWFPVSVLSILEPLCSHCFDEREIRWFFVIFVEVLPMLNSCCNPFIYAITNKQYREAFKRLLTFTHGMKARRREKQYQANTPTTMSITMATISTV